MSNKGPDTPPTGAPNNRSGRAARAKAPERDETDSFIDEVTEELQRDRLYKAGRRYGPFAIALIVGLVAAVGGYEYYQAQQTAKARAAGAELLAAETADDSAAAFAALAESGEGGAATLAKFRAAAAHIEAGDTDAAAANYQAIAAQAELPVKFRDLAQLKAAMLQLDDGDAQEAADQLAILSEFGRPYRPVALELQAAALLRLNDVDGARAALMDAIAAPQAPQGVQVRAQTLLATLGGPLGAASGEEAEAGGDGGSAEAENEATPADAAQDAQTQ